MTYKLLVAYLFQMSFDLISYLKSSAGKSEISQPDIFRPHWSEDDFSHNEYLRSSISQLYMTYVGPFLALKV